MTSGIRSNWMKAIRLCMDLQNSNKNKESKSSIDSTASSSTARTNDDMDIETSSSSSRTSDSARGPEKKKFIAKARRHYSDVNPGNIGKMFSVAGSSSGSSLASSKEPSLERDIKPESTLQTHMDLATTPKHGKYEPYWHGGDTGTNIPFRRFVEGSDSHVTSSTSSIDQSNKSEKYDEEERKKHGKSPSAKIKERSRAKSPKLHSPPPGEAESKFSYMTAPPGDDDRMSVSSDLDYMDAVDDVCILLYF